jgi:hypothetical protein
MIGPFLIKLVEQPDVLGHFLRDPEGAFDAEGLTSGEREILRSGSLRRLRETLQEEYSDREVFLAVVPTFGVFAHVPFMFAHVPTVQAPDEPPSDES